MRRRALIAIGALCWAGVAAAELGEPPALANRGGRPSDDSIAVTAKRGQVLPLQPARSIRFDTSDGTWLSPDISPDGKRIVFEMLGHLWLLDAHGGEARAITAGMAFDSQPAFSPDGRSIAFISDRSGAENLWIADADGAHPRQISLRDDNAVFVSPAWSADGRSIYVSRARAEYPAFELWRFDLASGTGRVIVPVKDKPDAPEDSWTSVLGATASPDGRWLYYAEHKGRLAYSDLPEWTINRRDLASGAEEVLVSAPVSPRPDLIGGTAFRPAPSHDGRLLAYAVRYQGRTGLRLLDLATRADRWLAFPVQQDELQASGWRDLFPHYAFTPDDRALILNDEGHIRRLAIADGSRRDIAFHAHVVQPLGPSLRQDIRQETGPVRARLIQGPEPSPDGRSIAFSALGHVYVMALDGSSAPRRLTRDDQTEWQPGWSPDGRTIAYVSWTARDAGQIWVAPVDGSTPPRRVSAVSAYYTNPRFAPDGRALIALRSSNYVRMHSYMEYGALRSAELVELPLDGKPARVIAKGRFGGVPQFTGEPGVVYVNADDGLDRVARDSGARVSVARVTGPGFYFTEGRAPADDLRISPDGRYLLAQIAEQLHLLAMPPPDGVPVDLDAPIVAHRKITDVGADFFAWDRDGKSIDWVIGSTFYRRPLAGVTLDLANAPPSAADAPPPGSRGVEAFHAEVDVPRDTPRGTLLLRGGTALTMRGEEAIDDADVLIVDDHIAAVGRRGSFAVPPEAVVRDITGRFVLPGFIDNHDHLADVRRGVLDLTTWGPAENLAYGVTMVLDPSPLSIDMLAYEDLMDAGLMTGSRIHSTGPAVFSLNEFRSYDEVVKALSRYPDDYRTRNLKEYRTGNRRVREWVAMACRRLGLMPTTEGALAMKLDMTQIIDGFSGNEHALTAVPLYDDMVHLVADSGVSYTTTLQITNGGPEGQDYFITRDKPNGDAKLRRFTPGFAVDLKTASRTWREPREYLFPRIAEGAAKVVRAGGLVGMGAHGEMPGLGTHWEMQAHAMGGMTPMEVLHAATIGAARAIGRGAEFGSIEPGKYADLVILTRDPRADIANTLSISAVMKNGRLYDAASLDEIWPRQKPFARPWFWDDDPPGGSEPGGNERGGPSRPQVRTAS